MPGKPRVTTEVFSEICSLVASGKTLAQVCRDMNIERFAVWEYRKAHEDEDGRYARARESQAEVWEEELLAIADDSSRDTIETEKGPIPDSEWINRSRLRVDARKWIMARSHPKGYGDKVETTLKGEGSAPIKFSIAIDRVNSVESEPGAT